MDRVIKFYNMWICVKSGRKCDHGGLTGMTIWDVSRCKIRMCFFLN